MSISGSTTSTQKPRRAYEDEPGLMDSIGKTKDGVMEKVTKNWIVSVALSIILIVGCSLALYQFGLGAFPASPTGPQDLMLPFMLHVGLAVGCGYFFFNIFDRYSEEKIKEMIAQGKRPPSWLITMARMAKKAKSVVAGILPSLVLISAFLMIASPFMASPQSTAFHVHSQVPCYSFDAHGHLLSTNGGYDGGIFSWGRGGDFVFHKLDIGFGYKFVSKTLYVIAGSLLLALTPSIATQMRQFREDYEKEIQEVNRSNVEADKRKAELDQERLTALRVQNKASVDATSAHRKQLEEIELANRMASD